MNKNEIVARFMGLIELGIDPDLLDMNYTLLHKVWVKFRDLKIDKDSWDEFHRIRRGIENSICYESITEAFDELVKGIVWYNSLTTNP